MTSDGGGWTEIAYADDLTFQQWFTDGVTQDGCAANGGEGGTEANATIFELDTPLVPVLNVQCRDCGNTFPEQFGSPLTSYPAWLR